MLVNPPAQMPTSENKKHTVNAAQPMDPSGKTEIPYLNEDSFGASGQDSGHSWI